MQYSMDGQPGKFGPDRHLELSCLLSRGIRADVNFRFKFRIRFDRKGQHIGRVVVAQEFGVESQNFPVIHNNNAQRGMSEPLTGKNLIGQTLKKKSGDSSDGRSEMDIDGIHKRAQAWLSSAASSGNTISVSESAMPESITS